jgi:bifunctional DNase/RNase
VQHTNTNRQSTIVVLREAAAGRVLPIFIGRFEAQAIISAIEGQQPQRPMTHDLTLRLLDGLHARVRQVLINQLLDSIFYAEITLIQNQELCTVDTRPSDALALAVRCDAPVLVARMVFDQASGDDSDEFWQEVATTAKQFRAKMMQPPSSENPSKESL